MSRSRRRWRSETPPRSYSIVVTATVAPGANTVATPRPAPAVRTTLATPAVMSTISPFPAVSRRSCPAWTLIASPASPAVHAHAREAPLAGLEHAAVELLAGDVERVGRHGGAVELHAALGEQAPPLRGRDAEGLAQHRGHVHDA